MHQDTYFYTRAEAELQMAQQARCPEAVKAHYELANLYLDRFYNPAGLDPGAKALAPPPCP